ncbi:MAG: class I SAM-dependent RNA methyltransferase [Acidimicrobiia bacterium]
MERPLLRLRPSGMAAGGDALARDGDGRVVFVTGALPGEEVVARLTDERTDYARAVVVDVVEASPDRSAPPCPALAAGCGGCTWQHVDPSAQVRLKAGIVVDALRRLARLPEPPVPAPVALDAPALRTTVRLAVGADGRAGHRPRGGRGAPVPADACLAVHPRLEELMVEGRYPGADEVVLRVGVSSGRRLAMVTGRGAAGRAVVPEGVAVVRGGARRQAWVVEEVAGRRFRISAESFFQPSPVAATALAEAVVDAAGDAPAPGAHAVDAYCGVGLFASVLAAHSGVSVTAVEQDPAALADARVNVADVGVRVVGSEVGRWRLDAGDRAPAVVVADPPRSGLGRPGVRAVVATGAPRVVLVSCDPASLARDASLLGEAGFRLVSVALVDAFPHTFHVETVARFDR